MNEAITRVPPAMVEESVTALFRTLSAACEEIASHCKTDLPVLPQQPVGLGR
jgi:hypothetical protein